MLEPTKFDIGSFGVVTDLSEELLEMVGLLTHLHHSTEPLTLVPAIHGHIHSIFTEA